MAVEEVGMKYLMIPLVLLVSGCVSSEAIQEQVDELKVIGEYHKAERVYLSAREALRVATERVDVATANEAKAKLELDIRREEMLKLLNQ